MTPAEREQLKRDAQAVIAHVEAYSQWLNSERQTPKPDPPRCYYDLISDAERLILELIADLEALRHEKEPVTCPPSSS